MNRIKLGIIGCGKQAAKHVAALKKIPGTGMVLTDILPEAAKSLAQKTECPFVEHPDAVYDDPEMQAVVICTPTRTHYPLIARALEKNIHVFCEKPLSENVEEIEALKKAEQSSDAVLTIGYIYRFVPAFEEGFRLFREMQLNGESLLLGKPLTAFFRLGGRGSHQVWKHRKETGGGAINEMLVHMIDLASWYFGPLNNIQIISNTLHLPRRMIQGEVVDADAEDFILVRCRGYNGIEIFCQADLVTPAFNQYAEIQAENGSFRGSIQQDSPSYVFLNEARGGFDAGKTVFTFGQRNLLDYQMLYYVLSILRSQKADKNTVEDSLQLTRIIDQIRHQIEENK